MATVFLKRGVEENLTAFDLGNQMVKNPEEVEGKRVYKPSHFENAIQLVEVNSLHNWREFKEKTRDAIEGVIEHAINQSRDQRASH